MNETFKKFGKRVGGIAIGIAAFVLGIFIRERNSSYRKRARGLKELADTAEDCNKSAQEGIEDAIRILQKARERED